MTSEVLEASLVYWRQTKRSILYYDLSGIEYTLFKCKNLVMFSYAGTIFTNHFQH